MSRIISVWSTGDKHIRKIMLGLAILSGFSIMVIMFTTVVDVSARYLFNKPWQNSVEFNQVMLILVIFFAIGISQAERNHIRVEIFTARFNPKVQELLWLLFLLVGFVYLLFLGIASWEHAIYSYNLREFTYGGGSQILYIWWSKFAIPVGCWAMCIQLLNDAMRSIMALFGIAPLQFSKRGRPEIDLDAAI
ncbi:TRAP transporter small permease subunit [Chloroflexota bacterium]